MPVKIGVDVGGTFTKAVACDAHTSEIVAESVVPTTHSSDLGVAEGVVRTIAEVADDVGRSGAGRILLLAHSTTQAVNALLEGDTAAVGVLGIGRRPDLRRARRRTHLGDVRLAPGRTLQTRHAFIDASAGLDDHVVRAALGDLVDRGAEVLCISEAFGVDDPRGEWLGLEAAAELGVPACAGHELTGLYGLEMRTVTAALNASILPVALRTAEIVGDAVAREVPGATVLVMRGDGGAAALESMRRRPLFTAFSGPAASVAGALHHLSLADGVVVEVGGTSTNVSAIHGGRPVLSYVRVLDHVTSVRSVDVRVAGVAGGSMVRVGTRFGRLRVYDVGPRSAHIAGLPYCSFSDANAVREGEARLVAPKPGDPAEYVVVEAPGGRRYALTLTCAANALGVVPANAYARGNEAAARAGFKALERATGTPWRDLAESVLLRAAAKIAAVVSDVVREHRLAAPEIVGVGGGAGALVPEVARAMGLSHELPPQGEVISSVGDALSLIRVDIERGLPQLGVEDVSRIHREAEEAAVAAGAAPETVFTESHALPDRRALRVVAVGALPLTTGVPNGEVDDEELKLIAKHRLGEEAELIATTGFYSVFATNGSAERDFMIIDARGSIAASGRGHVFRDSGERVAATLPNAVEGLVRHIGPLAVAPVVKVVRGSRVVDLSLLNSAEKVVDAAVLECTSAGSEPVVVVATRS